MTGEITDLTTVRAERLDRKIGSAAKSIADHFKLIDERKDIELRFEQKAIAGMSIVDFRTWLEVRDTTAKRDKALAAVVEAALEAGAGVALLEFLNNFMGPDADAKRRDFEETMHAIEEEWDDQHGGGGETYFEWVYADPRYGGLYDALPDCEAVVDFRSCADLLMRKDDPWTIS